MSETRNIKVKRILCYDWIETLAIFFVVSVHNVWLKENISASVAMSLVPMAVPLFFMVHGALLIEKNIDVKKNIIRILRVIFQIYAWNTVYLLVSLGTGLVVSSELTKEFLYKYYLCGVNSAGLSSGHLWFMYALVSVYVFYPVLVACKNYDRNILKYIVGVCVLFVFVRRELSLLGELLESHIGINLNVDWLAGSLGPLGRYANCICYFVLGYLMAYYVKSTKVQNYDKKIMIMSIVGVCIGVIVLLLERYAIFGDFKYNWKPLPNQYERIGTLIMAVSMFLLFSVIEFKDDWIYSVIKKISIHTIDIFFIHSIYGRYLYLLLYKSDLAGVVFNFIRAVCVMILSYYTGQIIRKIPIIKRLLI